MLSYEVSDSIQTQGPIFEILHHANKRISLQEPLAISNYDQACTNLVSKYVYFDHANLEKISRQQNFNA